MRLMIICYCLSLSALNAQNIHGIIKDATTLEPLVGAHIHLALSELGTISNAYGYFNIAMDGYHNDHELELIVSYVGFQSDTIYGDLESLQDISILLKPFTLGEVIVLDSRKRLVDDESPINLSLATLNKLPVIGSEPDVMKAFAILPGISQIDEGSSLLSIRGGSSDQNLVQIDEIPAYNLTHLGGYVSVINPESLKSAQVYRGYIPARYGGRLSSVIDLQSKDGNAEEFSGKINLGLLTSKLRLEGPVNKKANSSFIINGRLSYLSLINGFRSPQPGQGYFNYWLYDWNAKYKTDIGKGQLYFGLYHGQDVAILQENLFQTNTGSGISDVTTRDDLKWGNTIASLRYAIPLSPKLFSKYTLGYSSFGYKYTYMNLESFSSAQDLIDKQQSDLLTLSAKADFSYKPNSTHEINFGVQFSKHNFDYESLLNGHDDDLLTNSHYRVKPNELSLYLEDRISRLFADPLSISLGLRMNAFSSPDYSAVAFEPRIKLSYKVNKDLKIYSTFSRNAQFLHALYPNSSLVNIQSIWLPSAEEAPFQTSYEWGIGVQLDKGRHRLIVEPFYKRMNNVVDWNQHYINSEDFDLSRWREGLISGGKGKAYGAELFYEYGGRDWSLTFGYTLMWNKRSYPTINTGEYFPYVLDRRHDISISFIKQLSPKWSLSASWSYQSGRAFTAPIGRIPTDNGYSIPTVSEPNNARLPHYHRLDVSLSNSKLTKNGNRRTWNFSLYNAYNRRNALGISREANFGDFNLTSEKTKIVSYFPIIPSLSYTYEF